MNGLICYKCQKPLKHLGALLFSPPAQILEYENGRTMVDKIHICTECFKDLVENWLLTDNAKRYLQRLREQPPVVCAAPTRTNAVGKDWVG